MTTSFHISTRFAFIRAKDTVCWHFTLLQSTRQPVASSQLINIVVSGKGKACYFQPKPNSGRKADKYPEEDTLREQLVNYLTQYIEDIVLVRSYIGECLGNSGKQYCEIKKTGRGNSPTCSLLCMVLNH